MSIIYGTNTTKSALSNGRVKKLFVLNNFSNDEILKEAKSFSVPVVKVDKQKLDSLSKGKNHQGVCAEVEPYKTYELPNFLKIIENIKNPVIAILDELNDPHNLGAILRSADAFNISGVIFKKRGQIGLNDTVAKVSTGAIDYVPCVEVTNLTQTIKLLKKEGFWVIGLDGMAKNSLKDIPKDSKIALVIGSEGYGISRLVRENCDLLVKIPMLGHVSCLNASVAASICFYQIKN